MNALRRFVTAVVTTILPRSPFEVWDVAIELDPEELLADLTHNQS